MGIMKDMRHRVGIHTGEWVFDAEGACDETRRCTGCSNVSSRVSHNLGGWALRQPRGAHNCTSERVCGRCGLTETKQEHKFTFYYPDELASRPDLVAAPHFQPGSHSCSRVAACQYCTAMGEPEIRHDTLGTMKYNEDDMKYYYKCKRCGVGGTEGAFGFRPSKEATTIYNRIR